MWNIPHIKSPENKNKKNTRNKYKMFFMTGEKYQRDTKMLYAWSVSHDPKNTSSKDLCMKLVLQTTVPTYEFCYLLRFRKSMATLKKLK